MDNSEHLSELENQIEYLEKLVHELYGQIDKLRKSQVKDGVIRDSLVLLLADCTGVERRAEIGQRLDTVIRRRSDGVVDTRASVNASIESFDNAIRKTIEELELEDPSCFEPLSEGMVEDLQTAMKRLRERQNNGS